MRSQSGRRISSRRTEGEWKVYLEVSCYSDDDNLALKRMLVVLRSVSIASRAGHPSRVF